MIEEGLVPKVWREGGELKLRHLLPGSSAVPIILGFETLIHRHPLTDEDELS